ncbi:MAG: hypothetical protein AAGF57_08450 [Pseudomonadota bacterium]
MEFKSVKGLSENQVRYFEWLDHHTPYLLDLFEVELKQFSPELVAKYLGIASQRHAVMARFVLGVWRHQNHFDFDFVEAALVLDRQEMTMITDWMLDPFWP